MSGSHEIRIEDWSLTDYPSDGYTPPELRAKALCGVVHGHPHKADGEKIRTSVIRHIDGTRVTVASGHVYRLGAIDPQYRAYLDKEGYLFDEKNPIAFNKRAPRR